LLPGKGGSVGWRHDRASDQVLLFYSLSVSNLGAKHFSVKRGLLRLTIASPRLKFTDSVERNLKGHLRCAMAVAVVHGAWFDSRFFGQFDKFWTWRE
jgi:hypothetical protein